MKQNTLKKTWTKFMYSFHASKFLSNFSMLKLFLNSLYFWLKYKCDTNTYFHLFHSFLYFMQIIFYLYKVWQIGIIKKKKKLRAYGLSI